MMQDPFGYKIHNITVKEGKKYLFLLMILFFVFTMRLSFQKYLWFWGLNPTERILENVVKD